MNPINKIIQELEDRVQYRIPKIFTIEEVVEIIKQHESQFKEAIEEAYNEGKWHEDGKSGCDVTAQDYYNQKYKK